MRRIEVTESQANSLQDWQAEVISDGGLRIETDGTVWRWRDLSAKADFTIDTYTFLRGEEIQVEWKSGNISRKETQ